MTIRWSPAKWGVIKHLQLPTVELNEAPVREKQLLPHNRGPEGGRASHPRRFRDCCGGCGSGYR